MQSSIDQQFDGQVHARTSFITRSPANGASITASCRWIIKMLEVRFLQALLAGLFLRVSSAESLPVSFSLLNIFCRFLQKMLFYRFLADDSFEKESLFGDLECCPATCKLMFRILQLECYSPNVAARMFRSISRPTFVFGSGQSISGLIKRRFNCQMSNINAGLNFERAAHLRIEKLRIEQTANRFPDGVEFAQIECSNRALAQPGDKPVFFVIIQLSALSRMLSPGIPLTLEDGLGLLQISN